jgi:hypothetical protein
VLGGAALRPSEGSAQAAGGRGRAGAQRQGLRSARAAAAGRAGPPQETPLRTPLAPHPCTPPPPQIPNDITRKTPASFEPSIDYIVTKIPKFAFEKFPGTKAELTTQVGGPLFFF